MRALRRVLITLMFLACAHPALAAVAAATVEVVQPPAWLDRNGFTSPLVPGMELRSGDVLRTGAGARAYLVLAEGSRVKLGESARFVLYVRGNDPRRYFRGALDVLAGAFRYTTGLAAKRGKRDLSIRVATATVGIRGTDVWGRTDAQGEMIALLEGRIDITRGNQTVDMAQPMTFFDAPRGQPAAVRVLDPAVFKTLARQTEIELGDGAVRATGSWRVIAAAATDNDAALELYDRVRAAGFGAKLRPQPAGANAAAATWIYEVVVPGFASESEARAAAARIKAATGLSAQAAR